MSSNGDEPQPESLRDVQQAVSQRNVLLRRLAGSVDALAAQVRKLRREIDDRPTKAQAEHRRRRTAAAMLVFAVALVWGHDQHIQSCSPGSNALAVLQAFADPPAGLQQARSPEEQRAVYRAYLAAVFKAQPTERCDITAPLSSHDPAEEWPTRWNWLGFGLYAALGGILWGWSRGPARSRSSGEGRWEET